MVGGIPCRRVHSLCLVCSTGSICTRSIDARYNKAPAAPGRLLNFTTRSNLVSCTDQPFCQPNSLKTIKIIYIRSTLNTLKPPGQTKIEIYKHLPFPERQLHNKFLSSHLLVVFFLVAPTITRHRDELGNLLLINLVLSVVVSEVNTRVLYGYFCEVIHSVMIVEI
jgi:hypothetical protein